MNKTYICVYRLQISLQTGSVFADNKENCPTLDPLTIPKFVNQLIIPPVYAPAVVKDTSTGKVVSYDYTIDASEFQQQILPSPLPSTKVWGYGGTIKDPQTGNPVYFRNAPGATIEAVRGIPVNVKWENKLTGPHLYAVDPTLHWANPNMMPMDPPLPWPAFPATFPQAQAHAAISPHLHGGET